MNKQIKPKLSKALKQIELEIAKATKARERDWDKAFERLYKLKAKRLQIIVAES